MATVTFNSTTEWRLTAAGGCAAVWQLILCSDDVCMFKPLLASLNTSLIHCGHMP